MLEEGEAELWLAAYPGHALAQVVGHVEHVVDFEVGELAALDVAPQRFDRIEVRRVRRQLLDREPRLLLCQVAQHLRRAVGVEAYPSDEPHPGGGTAQLCEQLAPAAEERTQQPRDGQDDVAVGDRGQHLVAQPLGPQDLSLLLARGAERAAAAGKGDEHAAPALGAPQPSEAVLEQAAAQELPLGRISKRGDSYLRLLFIHGARSALCHAKKASSHDHLRTWALKLHSRVRHNKAAVALANKMARIAWAVWKHGRNYQTLKPAA